MGSVHPVGVRQEHGQPWAYATLHGHFGAILCTAELSHHTPHDTRHTFAVNLLDWTHDIDYVAEMLGDSLTVVVATYLERQGARDKSEQYARIGDPKQGARIGPGTAARLTQPVATWTQPWPR